MSRIAHFAHRALNPGDAIATEFDAIIPAAIYSDLLEFFTPSDIANVAAWYDFTDISTLYQDDAKTTPVTGDGDPVGAVESQIGSFDLIQSGVDTLKPTYRSGSGGYLEFDGGDNYEPLLAILTASVERTLACAAVVAAASDRIMNINVGNSRIFNQASDDIRFGQTEATSNLNSGFTGTTPRAIMQRTESAVNADCWVDGVDVGSFDPKGSIFTGTGVAFPTITSFPPTGNYTHFVIVNGVITAAEIAALNTYLLARLPPP